MACENITNSTVIDKYVANGKKNCSNWLLEEGKKLSIPIASVNAYTSACESIYKRFKNLQKSAGREKGKIDLSNFLSSNIIFPKPLISKRQTETVFKDCSSSEDMKVKVAAVNQVSMDVSQENKTLKAKLLEHKLKLKQKLNKKSAIDALKLRVKSLTTEKKRLTLSNDAYRNMITKKNSELKRLRSRITYTDHLKNQDMKKAENLNTELQTARELTDSILLELKTIKQEMRDVQNENDWLREILKNYENETIESFDKYKGSYTPALQKCVYTLLTHHVATGQVSGVIETVLSMVNKKCDRLPSASTVQNMSIQKVGIAQKQIADVCPDKKTLHCIRTRLPSSGTKFVDIMCVILKAIFSLLGCATLFQNLVKIL